MSQGFDKLSPREIQILELIERGMPTKQIARTLVPRCGEETVKTHLKRLFNKLGVQTRAQAVAVYRKHSSNQWVSPKGGTTESAES